MKNVYWRPQSIPLYAFILVAFFSVGGLIAVEHFQMTVRKPHYHEKLDASRRAQQAMELIKIERLRQKAVIDVDVDPAESGLIGAFVTPVTSDAGDLEAKQTSVNPNFAAVVVQLLEKAKVKAGDSVAVSFSGSFPALNIAVCAALTTLDLKPTIISSVGASQWGANDPQFLWIDMENFLFQKGIFSFRSTASSMGGKNDRGRGMSQEGRKQILEAIKRNDLPIIKVSRVGLDIDERMSIYFDHASPKVYINVGGGLAAAGTKKAKRLMKPGLQSREILAANRGDSVINRFLKEGIPVIQIDNVKELAKDYDLPVAPVSMPKVGEGNIYRQKQYNLWLAGGVLLGIILGLYIFGRVDWGFRMLRTSAKEEAGPPEPMI